MVTLGKGGKFVRVVCYRCGNTQVVFGKSAVDVKCLKCRKLLVKSRGGKSKIVTRVKEVLVKDERT